MIMAESKQQRMAFKCLNPECGKIIEMPRPEKSGVYSVVCPFCGIKKQIKLKGLEEVIDNSANPPILVKDDFIVGVSYKLTCPHCEKAHIDINPPKAGICEIACPSCKGKVRFKVRRKTHDASDEIQPYRGKLVQSRRLLPDKSYNLGMGRNVVGRFDPDDLSDINIKGDKTISRRSVEINVEKTVKEGFTFKLKVLNATNPVTLNGKVLSLDSDVYLRFGDKLMLGKTTLLFEKDI